VLLLHINKKANKTTKEARASARPREASRVLWVGLRHHIGSWEPHTY
jgi:hypothetical protein